MSRLPALLLFASLAASADVSGPLPGVTLVRHAGAAMTIANLCAPGVSVRATRWSERQATPQQWAQGIGAQVAINADFFDFPGWSYILVRARGAGEDWPAGAMHLEQPSSYWQFGNRLAGFEPNSLVTPGPQVTEVVGAYDSLILGGVAQGSTDPFMLANYRRSAIGLSADRRTLYFYASNWAINGPNMANEMIAMAAEAGAPPIELATNQDGGGSSQLYVQGLGQIITSGRQVNTHLGIYASGSGPSPNCNDTPPRGFLDGASCDGIVGWAQDTDAPDAPLAVHLYFGGPAGSGAVGIPIGAGLHRDDLCTALGSCNHGFAEPPPLSLLDGQPHEVHAYGIGALGGVNTELAASPKTLTCAQAPPPGVLRHVVDEAAFAAFRFEMFRDVQHVTDAALAEHEVDRDFPSEPVLIAADGDPRVYLVDRGGTLLRHVPNPEVAARWHLDLSKVQKVTAEALAMTPIGPELSARPWLVEGSGPAIYVIDTKLLEPVLTVGAEVAPPGDPAAAAAAHGGLTSWGGCASTPGGLAGLIAVGLLAARRRGRRG